ncbi:MAG: hypothetical protein EOO20_26065 [Chryseobacterium sp.]|nr:MAG: hypothetical protein EOO20_26065 [Chryseobacterium sp.]
MTPLKYTPLNIELDFVISIDCLPEGEREKFQLAQTLTADLKDIVTHAVAKCDNRSSFFKLFDSLKQKAAGGNQFCINFITHGNQDGIGFKANKEFISWDELSVLLQPINEYMKGQLLINMVSCQGLYGIKMSTFAKDTFPCYGLIGSQKSLKVSHAKIINQLFYQGLAAGKSIEKIMPEIITTFDKTQKIVLEIYCSTAEGYSYIEQNKDDK